MQTPNITIVAITSIFRIFRKDSVFTSPLVHLEDINPITALSFENDLFMINIHDPTPTVAEDASDMTVERYRH
jgi:hypothetical protein